MVHMENTYHACHTYMIATALCPMSMYAYRFVNQRMNAMKNAPNKICRWPIGTRHVYPCIPHRFIATSMAWCRIAYASVCMCRHELNCLHLHTDTGRYYSATVVMPQICVYAQNPHLFQYIEYSVGFRFQLLCNFWWMTEFRYTFVFYLIASIHQQQQQQQRKIQLK